jgi:hypothetical protein
VKCAILEGGMLADMQIGQHLAKIKGLLSPTVIINHYEFKLAWTANGDGTSNKHIGYYSHHANIQKLSGESESNGLELLRH